MSPRVRFAARWALPLALVASSALAAPNGEWPPGPGGSRQRGAHAELEEQAEELEQRLAALGREDQQNQAITIARGRAYVRLARAGLMPLSAGFDALAAHASRLERLRRALGRDLARARQIAAQRIETAKALEALASLKPAERDALARARSAVAAAEERDAAFERAFESDWSPAPRARAAVYGAEPSAAAKNDGDQTFASRRGRLPFPLAGRAEIQTVPSPSGQGKALLIAGPLGAPVRAVHAGRVAFAADHPEHGLTVILDHGNQFYTSSSHLERITVEVGEELDAGERIGTLGSVDQKPGLLFEIRAGATTVNTAEWFGI